VPPFLLFPGQHCFSAVNRTKTVGISYNYSINQPLSLRQAVEIQYKSKKARFLHDFSNGGHPVRKLETGVWQKTLRDRHMTTGFTRFAAIAVATASILTAQNAAAGVLITSNPTRSDWFDPGNWVGGNTPDTVGEDAQLTTGMIVTVNDFSIGGIESHSPRSLFMGTNGLNTGTLRLDGISGSVGAGTAAFDSSTVAHLAVSGNGVFTNAGSSTLVIGRISVSGNGFLHNLTNPSGRMDLGAGQH
jgi:hypothetical protein